MSKAIYYSLMVPCDMHDYTTTLYRIRLLTWWQRNHVHYTIVLISWIVAYIAAQIPQKLDPLKCSGAIVKINVS